MYQKTLAVMNTIKHDPAIEYQLANHHRGTTVLLSSVDAISDSATLNSGL